MSYQFSTTTSLSDETYLESFIESISASLPNDLRRNLEHLRDLDRASSALLEEWRGRQDGCLKGVEAALLEAFRGEAAAAVAAEREVEEDDGDDDDDRDENDSSEGGDAGVMIHTRRGTKRKISEKISDKKTARIKRLSREAKCDGKNHHSLNSDSDYSGDDGESSVSVNEKQHKGEQSNNGKGEGGAEYNHQGHSTASSPVSQSDLSEYFRERGPPTAEEIQTALHAHNPHYAMQRVEISNMCRELRQFSDEKMDTANQIKSMVDMALGRLDRDLEKFEKELGIDSNQNATAAAGVNSVGGGTGNVAGIGSGAVGHHTHRAVGRGVLVGTGVHPVGNSSSTVSAAPAATAPKSGTASNPSGLRRSSSSASSVPPPTAPSIPRTYPSLRGTVPPPPRSVQTSSLAAIQVTPNSPDWILAKILSHDKSSKTYTLSDEDVQSNQIYKIPERQVVVLRGTERNRWCRGDAVYAVYPDTTSFYRATVSTPPLNGFVMVQFKDDWDANGVTHEKAVLMAHVMKIPPGRK